MKRTTLFALLFLTACLQNGISQQKTEQPDFYETNKIQDIRVTFATDKWSYILDSLRFNGNGFLEASVEINGQRFEGAGIQYRGTKSFIPGGNRNPFNIVLNHKNKGQAHQGYSTLKLSNSLRDPSMVREVLGYEIARAYMPAPKANYARLHINGNYYGLVVNIESVQDPKFRERFFGRADYPFFKAKEVINERGIAGCKNNIYGSLEYDNQEACYDFNFENLSGGSLDPLMKLAKTLSEDLKNIESVLNVDETLWMLAYNNVLVNLSSYTGQHSVNYFVYQDGNGRFTPIIWDMNLSFGSFKNIGTGSDLRIKDLIEMDPLLHLDNTAKPLISKLLGVEPYKKTYLSHMRTILHEQFLSGKYASRAKELQKLIRVDLANDMSKEYTMDDFDGSLEKVIGKKSKIPGITYLMDKRADFLKKHPALSVFPPDVMNVTVAGRERLSNKAVEDFRISAKIDKFPKKVTLVYRLDGNGEYKKVNLTDDGKTDDGMAGNGIFGATISPKNGEKSIEYYIVAENAGLFSYSPANYMWEKHRATLEGLNK